MQVEKYLHRIGIENGALAAGRPDPARLQQLRQLQRQHLLRVPFENLDIHWKRPIVLDTESFFKKIVGENRGGFCYELNGLFNALLQNLGFKSRMISARVAQGEGAFGAEYDHMAVIAEADGGEYLADVGFGAFVAEPLRLALDIEQQDATGVYRISQYDDEYLLVAKKVADGWQNEYIFTVKPRALAEYAAMCEFHQTSPESHFTRNKVCSLLTETGRKTLTNDKFIETKNGERSELAITSERQFNEILKREFDIAPVN